MAEQTNQPTSAGVLSARFADAFAFAFEVHRKQTKKSTPVPYMAHLLEVAGLVLNYGGTEDEAIAALLHDAVEDHPDVVSFSLLGERFGAAGAASRRRCSDAQVVPHAP